MNIEYLFKPEIEQKFPRLERLFEQSKEDFWNESTVVDWSQPIDMVPEKRRALARVLSIIYYGERAALEVSAQLISMVDDEECKFALAAQVIEEAKHVSVFRRVLTKLDQIHPVDPWSKRLLADLVLVKDTVAKLIGMQLIVENVANHLFVEIGRACEEAPLLSEVLKYVARDEKKHTGIAAIYLPKVLERTSTLRLEFIKLRQVYWSFCLDRTIYNHRYDADALGIDLFDAMIKGIKAQERLVESMGTRRGIWKNRFLESLSLRMYRKHNEENERRAQQGQKGKAWTRAA
ncbi:MAG: ferritin-like domain-containing protein [Deltaproteobacteria bacterium]|nr:ferritin-like domain-containing protein [Deltaproteobacteria bacterium]